MLGEKLAFYNLRLDPGSVPPDVLERLFRIGMAGFRFPPEKADYCRAWLAGTLARADWLALLEGDGGCFFLTAPERRLLGKRLVWGDGGCVVPALQRGSWVSRVLGAFLEHQGVEPFGWVGGRTQSPAALQAVARLGYLRPVHGPYTDDEGRAIVEFLAQEIPQLNGLPSFDPESGICKSAFPGSIVPPDLSDLAPIEGLDPARGDVLILVSRLDLARRDSR